MGIGKKSQKKSTLFIIRMILRSQLCLATILVRLRIGQLHSSRKYYLIYCLYEVNPFLLEFHQVLQLLLNIAKF